MNSLIGDIVPKHVLVDPGSGSREVNALEIERGMKIKRFRGNERRWEWTRVHKLQR
jgi:hypothetical protein